MKSALRLLPVAALLALPVVAQAHPGHDGDHDFVWDFDHLATHPFATVAYVAIVVGLAFGLRRYVLARRANAERAKRD